jgi:hypothetical protein
MQILTGFYLSAQGLFGTSNVTWENRPKNPAILKKLRHPPGSTKSEIFVEPHHKTPSPIWGGTFST